MDRGAAAVAVVIESDLVAETAGDDESVAMTVKLEVPAVVGVPEMTPDELRERPAGSVPEERVQV
jgi:hypothetical protein